MTNDELLRLILTSRVYDVARQTPLERLKLARSNFTADYRLCWDGVCHPLAEFAGKIEKNTVIEIFVCSK